MTHARSRRSPDPIHQGMRALLAPSASGRSRALDEHELHVDEDLVCPRCLRWIEPGDYVRQTRIGLRQHEACG